MPLSDCVIGGKEDIMRYKSLHACVCAHVCVWFHILKLQLDEGGGLSITTPCLNTACCYSGLIKPGCEPVHYMIRCFSYFLSTGL